MTCGRRCTRQREHATAHQCTPRYALRILSSCASSAAGPRRDERADLEHVRRSSRRASAMCAFCSTSRIVVPSAAIVLHDLEDQLRRSAARGRATARRAAAACGRDSSARAIASICCSPPESVPAFCASRSREAREQRRARASRSFAIAARVRAQERAELEVLVDGEVREDAAALGHVRRARRATISCGRQRRVMSACPRELSTAAAPTASRARRSRAASSSCRRRSRRSA